MKSILNFISVLIVLVALAACTDDNECRKEKYVAMNIKFYSQKFNSTRDTVTIKVLSVDSLTVKAIRNDGTLLDSVLYRNQKKVSSVYVPLNSFDKKTFFQLTMNTVTDTVLVQHTVTNEFLSLECGCLKIHTIDSVKSTGHYIDALDVKNASVNTSTNVENIRIFHTIN